MNNEEPDAAMADKTFILHHYDESPYAEKLRAMFGLTGDDWGSVLSPPFPPRPNVDPLVGGYRRIPVAQLGADLFCDTTLIAAEVAALSGHAALAPAVVDAAAASLAERAEGPVFFAAITSVPPLKLLGGLIMSQGPFKTLKFVRDRAGMMRGAEQRPPQGREASALFESFLTDVEHHLADRETIDGQELGYADFCVYHPIWLARSVGGAKSLSTRPHLKAWMDRMDRLGHGGRREIPASQAFAEAADNEPRALPGSSDGHQAVGQVVTITPSDYAKVGVSGTLVAATPERYVLRRDTERFGALHVHFPVEGYALTA